jgi:YHS domain-containing protein
MMRAVLLTAMIGLGSPALRAETPPPTLALKGLDPVALAVGQETPGLATIEASYGRFTYRFANEANKKTFQAKPEEHAIQFGGACGKMGPFSGTGNAERYFLHDQRIYIFASEFCRDAFKKAPDQYIEKPNPAPTGTEDEWKRGRQLVVKAVDGFGGAKVVDAIKTLRRVEKIVYRQGGKETVGTGRTTWAFPESVRVEEDYGTPYGYVVAGAKGFEHYGKQTWALESAVRDAGWRSALREPLLMLRHRDAKGFVAVARGENKVEVGFGGATSVWSLDAKTGRILKAEYSARRGPVGDNVVEYSDFKAVDGVVLPHARAESFNGKKLAVPERIIQPIEVNPELKPELFLQPK